MTPSQRLALGALFTDNLFTRDLILWRPGLMDWTRAMWRIDQRVALDQELARCNVDGLETRA